jgi:hypothetical protein
MILPWSSFPQSHFQIFLARFNALSFTTRFELFHLL